MAEVEARRARGEGNESQGNNGRSTLDIIRTNLFSFFNNILYAIGIMLVALGQTIHPEELVLGDLVVLRSGEQAVVDGRFVSPDRIVEMDESLLTGKTDLIRKQNGDEIMSGSYCVTGEGVYEVTAVGADNYANQVTASAREFEVRNTPLQRQINFEVRLVMLIVVIMSLVIFAAAILEDLTLSRLVEMAAVLTGLVPYGLFTMIVGAYAISASKIAKEGALVQQTNAIESLSNIDVLPDAKTLHAGEDIHLPKLTPLAVVSLRDQLRPYATETLATFEQLGIDLKIISGDNPRTVAALAKQAGLKNDVPIPPRVQAMFEERTGLTYGVDEGFDVAVSKIVAQSFLSVFVSYTAIILVLFLEPPHKLFEG